MSKTDTSAEAIECMARYYDDEGKHMEVANAVGDATTAEYAACCRATAATLRALLAERDALRKALAPIERLPEGAPPDNISALAWMQAAMTARSTLAQEPQP